MATLARIGWRGLGRNRRRTLLMAGGVAFVVLLVATFSGLQLGSYRDMQHLATDLYTGHVQIARPQYVEEAEVRDAIPGVAALIQHVERQPGVQSVSARFEAFVLASSGERSFGAMLVGIDVPAELRTVGLLQRIVEGTPPQSTESVVIGWRLATNLGLAAGEELMLLGSDAEGGVAAYAATVAGLLNTGNAELDRNLVLAPIADLQSAYGMDDQAHTLVVRGDVPENSRDLAVALQRELDAIPLPATQLRARPWQDILPEISQAIAIDRVSADIMYWLLLAIVAFSVLNAFVMTVFERVREIGVMRAVGMRYWKVLLLLQWEALYLWLAGTAIGVLLGVPVLWWLQEVGVPLSEGITSSAMGAYMPERMRAELAPEAFFAPVRFMAIATHIAALLPVLRLRSTPVTQLLRGVTA